MMTAQQAFYNAKEQFRDEVDHVFNGEFEGKDENFGAIVLEKTIAVHRTKPIVRVLDGHPENYNLAKIDPKNQRFIFYCEASDGTLFIEPINDLDGMQDLEAEHFEF